LYLDHFFWDNKGRNRFVTHFIVLLLIGHKNHPPPLYPKKKEAGFKGNRFWGIKMLSPVNTDVHYPVRLTNIYLKKTFFIGIPKLFASGFIFNFSLGIIFFLLLNLNLYEFSEAVAVAVAAPLVVVVAVAVAVVAVAVVAPLVVPVAVFL
jgi:hypothetical protein